MKKNMNVMCKKLIFFRQGYIIKYLKRARVGWPTGNPRSHFLNPHIPTANTTITAPTMLQGCTYLKINMTSLVF